MLEDDRKIFLRVLLEENARRKMNLKNLAERIGRSSGALYKLMKKGKGGHDLLERVSREVFGRPWISIVAEQNAEQNKGQEVEAGAVSGGGKVWIDSDYLENLKRRVDALQMLVEQHLKVHGDGKDGDLKKTG